MMSVAGDREDGDEAVNRSAIFGDITAGQAVPDGNSWSSADGGGGLGRGVGRHPDTIQIIGVIKHH